jgi:hypothetical protein
LGAFSGREKKWHQEVKMEEKEKKSSVALGHL